MVKCRHTDAMNFTNKHIQAVLNRDPKYLVGITAVVLIMFVLSLLSFNSAPPEKELPIDIPAYGTLSSLQEAVQNNSELRSSIEQLWSYDEAFIFVNDQEVNGLIAEILFLWSGFSKQQIKKYNSATLIHNFLRRTYDLPRDEPVLDNPAIPDNAWPYMFNRYKTRLLMLSSGKNIYKSDAYYDPVEDQIFVTGTLSNEYLSSFKSFLDTLPANDKKRVSNNFLSFIHETKGLQNLSDKEKEKVKQLR